jgi:hypothetical protein
MRTKSTRCVILFAGICVLTACGGSSGSSGNATPDAVKAPDAVQVAQLDAYGKGQFGREYDLLLDAQRQLIDRNLFITCGGNKGIHTITDLKVVEQYDEPIDIPGVSATPVPAKAVTLSMKANGQDLTVTLHSIQAADGTWHWIADPASMTAYQAGKCP